VLPKCSTFLRTGVAKRYLDNSWVRLPWIWGRFDLGIGATCWGLELGIDLTCLSQLGNLVLTCGTRVADGQSGRCYVLVYYTSMLMHDYFKLVRNGDDDLCLRVAWRDHCLLVWGVVSVGSGSHRWLPNELGRGGEWEMVTEIWTSRYNEQKRR
jgi:hypothetical protein